MPEKDGSDDKKSTKSVVNKKQKQLMNKEQLDLTSVAESFGGKIVGEPVLVEFKQSPPPNSANQIKKFSRTNIKTNKYLDLLKKGLKVKSLLGLFKKHPKVAVATTLLTPTPLADGTLDGNKEIIAKLKKQNLVQPNKKDEYKKLYSKDELLLKKNALQNKEIEKKEKEKENEKIIVPDKKEIEKIKVPDKQPQIEPYKEPGKKPETEVNLDKLKNIDKNQKKIVTTNDSDSDTRKDSKTNLSVLPLASNQKVNKNKKTKLRTKKGKDFNFRGLKLPGTPHNVGRRVNPQ